MKFKKLTILGKEYEFVKPKGVHIMMAEDKAYRSDGTLDTLALQNEFLKFVSNDLRVDSFEKDFNPVMVIGEKIFTLKDTSLKKKSEIDGKVFAKGRFSRVSHVQAILDNVVEDYKIEDLTYEELESLPTEYNKNVDDSELLGVIDSIKTFR